MSLRVKTALIMFFFGNKHVGRYRHRHTGNGSSIKGIKELDSRHNQGRKQTADKQDFAEPQIETAVYLDEKVSVYLHSFNIVFTICRES